MHCALPAESNVPETFSTGGILWPIKREQPYWPSLSITFKSLRACVLFLDARFKARNGGFWGELIVHDIESCGLKDFWTLENLVGAEFAAQWGGFQDQHQYKAAASVL
jgi:hypothetical protein